MGGQVTGPQSVRASVLTFALVAVALLAVVSRPTGSLGSEMWPVGLAVALVMVTRRGRVWIAGTVVALVAVGSHLFVDRPWPYAVASGVLVAVEALVVAGVLTRGFVETARLRDLGRYAAAVGAGSVLAGVGTAVAAATLTSAPPLVTGLGVLVGHLSALLVLLPFFLEQDDRLRGVRGERVAQWVLLAVVTTLVFAFDHSYSLLFTLVPILVWSAMRNSVRQAQLQLLLLTFIGTVLTSFGYGPLAASTGELQMPGGEAAIVLQTFIAVCAVVVAVLVAVVAQENAAVDRVERERDLLSRVVDSAHVAIIGADARGRVNLFNPGARRLLGYSPEEVMGQPTSMLHTDAAISAKAAELGVPDEFGFVAMRLAQPGHAGTNMSFLRKDGTERAHAMTLSPIRDSSGNSAGWVCTSADVTEEVAARQALIEALDTERRAVQQLQELDLAKDTFVSSVSHELRTPITSIVGYLEMLLEGEFGDLNAGQQSAIRRIDSNSRRLLSLIDELLTLSRLHERQADVTEEIDLAQVARTAYDVVAPSWEHRELDARIDLPREPVHVLGDRELLERVLVNLLGNAVKFTPEGGALRLSLHAEGSEAVLSVRDTGIGIPLDEQQHLFTRFFRSSLARHHAIQGSGLGLSIARTVIEEHGGHMLVDSRPGEGTVFWVRVPLACTGNVKTSTIVGAGDP